MQIGFQKIRGIPLRLLSFLSSSVSPRCNFILHPSCDRDLFFDSLFRVKGWDLIYAPNFEAGQQTTLDFLAYLEQKRPNQYESEPSRESPYQVIGGSWDDYYNGLSKNHRKNIRVMLKRLDDAGSHSFEIYESFPKAEAAIERMIEVSGASWKAQSASDMKSNRQIADFYRDFSREGSGDNLWLLHMLKINDSYVAFDYYLKFGNRLTGIRSDYNMTFQRLYAGAPCQNRHHQAHLFQRRDLGVRHRVAWPLNINSAIPTKLEIISISSPVRPGLTGKLLMIGKKKFWPMLKRLHIPAFEKPGP